MASFKIYTLGCKVNQYDSNILAERLSSAGFVLAGDKADLAIINSCAVTQNAIRKGRQIVNKAKRENPKAKVILMGCWTRVYDIKNDNIDLVIKDRKINSVFKKITNNKLQITNKFQNPNVKFKNIRKIRFFLKIQDGCEQYCSYCVIPYARGPLQSRPEKEIIVEAKHLVNSGVREIVLCGIHLGLCGREGKSRKVKGKRYLVELLQKISKIDKLKRVRLSSIEVTEVGEDLIELIKTEKKVCRHLHIPLQSGCDKILKLMNRPYGTKYFRDRIREIRKLIPSVAITTDVIVGFPGETEKDFRATYNFIKEIGFSKLHVFPFSAHEKAPASKFSGKVNEKIIKERVVKLIKLGEKLEKCFRKKFIGKKVEVLVEYKKGKRCLGKTEQYLDMEFDRENCKLGEVVKVKLLS